MVLTYTFLAGRKDGGEFFHPLANLHYRKRQKRKKKVSYPV